MKKAKRILALMLALCVWVVFLPAANMEEEAAADIETIAEIVEVVDDQTEIEEPLSDIEGQVEEVSLMLGEDEPDEDDGLVIEYDETYDEIPEEQDTEYVYALTIGDAELYAGKDPESAFGTIGEASAVLVTGIIGEYAPIAFSAAGSVISAYIKADQLVILNGAEAEALLDEICTYDEVNLFEDNIDFPLPKTEVQYTESEDVTAEEELPAEDEPADEQQPAEGEASEAEKEPADEEQAAEGDASEAEKEPADEEQSAEGDASEAGVEADGESEEKAPAGEEAADAEPKDNEETDATGEQIEITDDGEDALIEGEGTEADAASALTITTQPVDFVGAIGDMATFKVVANGGSLTYRWEWLKAGTTEWKNSSSTGYNTNTLKVQMAASNVGNKYRCVVSNGTSSVTSNAGAIVKGVTITTQPVDFVGAIGDMATFKVVARGSDLTYRWEWLKAGTTEWKNSSSTGYNTDTLTVKMAASNVGNKYRCVVSNGEGSVTSNAGAIVQGVTITTQPEDFVGAIGDMATFKVVASGSSLTYRWEWLKAGTTEWKNSSSTGYNTNTLTVKMAASNVGNKYRCVVSNGASSITSDAGAIVQGVTITTQPEDFVGAIGDMATFKVVASGSGLTYRWEWLKAGTTEWKNSSSTGYNTNTLTVKMAASNVGNKYRCVVSNGTSSVISDAGAIVQGVTITTQPEDFVGAIGDMATFKVVANGGSLTYRWEWLKAGTTEWKNSSSTGYNTNTLTVKMAASNVGNKYRCVVSNGTSSVISDAGAIVQGVTITTQPEDFVGAIGDMATFKVVANGGSLTYRWEWLKAGTTEWKNSSSTGYNTNTLTVKMAASNVGNKYRCVVSNGTSSVISDAGAIVQGVTITTQPEDFVGAIGDMATFKVVASGGSLTYRWEWLKAGTTEWKNSSSTGYNTNTLTVKMAASNVGNKYRCVVSNGASSVTSDAGAIVQGVTITTQPEDFVGAIGDMATFKVVANGGSLTYRWEWLKAGTTEWKNSSSTGYNTNTLTVKMAASNVGNKYRCVVSNGASSVISDAGAIVQGVTITTQPEDFVGAIGDMATFKVVASGSGLTYRWEWLKAGTTEWKNSSSTGYNTNTLTVKMAASNVGNKYRCVVSNGASSVISDAGAIVQGVTITTQPEDFVGAIGDMATFKVVASGSGLTYRWEWLKAGTTEWKNSSSTGYNTNTLTVKMAASNVGNKYRCVVSNGESSVTSDEAEIIRNTHFVINNVVYELIDNTMVVTGYETAVTSYVVEGVVENTTVTRIGESAFEGNTKMTSIDLPDSITVIGKRAFANCTNLSNMF